MYHVSNSQVQQSTLWRKHNGKPFRTVRENMFFSKHLLVNVRISAFEKQLEVFVEA